MSLEENPSNVTAEAANDDNGERKEEDELAEYGLDKYDEEDEGGFFSVLFHTSLRVLD